MQGNTAKLFLTGSKFSDSEGGFLAQLKTAIEKENRKDTNPIFVEKSLAEDDRTKGAKLFRQICASCHGIKGQGIQGLAPPLMNSEYIDETEKLALIILHGLEGPVHVNGKLYEMNQAMPGLIQNKTISDEDITDIISYITNAFSDMPERLELEKIQRLRKMKSKSGAEYTEEELKEYSIK
jgi:mono/diheme cytochrome c family protein